MFDFIDNKSTQKDKAKSSTPEPSGDAPKSLLDVVVPFPQTDEKTAELPPDSLLSQIDALSRKHEDIVAEKLAMERAELRAKRVAFEREEQAARLKAEQEASLRFKQKADFLDEEIERVRHAKIREMNAEVVEQAPAGAFREPMSQPANQPQAAPPPPPNSVQQEYHTPPGYAPATETQRPGYAPWPARENVPQGGAMPPVQDHFVPQQHNQYQSVHRDDYRGGADQTGRLQGAPSAPDQYREYRQAESYGLPPYSANPQEVPAPYTAPPHTVPPYGERQPFHAGTADTAQARQMRHSEPNKLPEPGLYDSYQEEQPQGRQSRQRQSMAKQAALDLDGIMRMIFSSWKLIGFMAIIGAVLAGAYSMTLTNKYQAWAELIIDPSDLKVLENQLSPTGYSGDAMIAYLRSQQRIIESSSVLKEVIVNEHLMSDKEFNGENSGISGWRDIILPAPRDERDVNQHQRVLEKLQKSLVVSRGNGTFVYSIGVTTEDALKSAKIANAVATAYVEGEAAARSKVATDTSGNLKGKLALLEKNVRLTEQKVADYKAKHKIFSSEGKLTSEVQLSRLNEQLANAKVATINAKTRMEQAQATNLADVISGSLPTSLATNTISQLRIRYASLKSNADRLATKLGSRHPERIAAQAELSSARQETSKEIKRIISGTSKEYQRARKRQQDLSQQVMVLKATSVGVGSTLIALHQLERELSAHQRVYENYLLRSRETGQQEGIASANARIISTATAPLKKIGPQRRIFAVMGLIAGGAVGLVFALLGGFTRSRSRLPDERFAETGRHVTHPDAAYVEGDRGPYVQERYAQPPQAPPQPNVYPPYGAQRPYA